MVTEAVSQINFSISVTFDQRRDTKSVASADKLNTLK
jgi:hypothetical protein